MRRSALFVLLTLALTASVSAHYIWLERADNAAHLYFGEVQENEREKSPGKLDKMEGVRFFVQEKNSKTREIPLVKTANFFKAPLKGERNLYATNEVLPVQDLTRFGIGIVKPFYYARWGTAGTEQASVPAQTLHFQPAAKSKNTFQLFFEKKPLAKAKVHLYAPNTWIKEYRTDDSGKIQIDTPWNGQYVLEVVHVEKVAGTFQGKAYEARRHRATYTFVHE